MINETNEDFRIPSRALGALWRHYDERKVLALDDFRGAVLLDEGKLVAAFTASDDPIVGPSAMRYSFFGLALRIASKTLRVVSGRMYVMKATGVFNLTTFFWWW